jgi:hypothetical protein
MLIEGGYLHSLKALLEKADGNARRAAQGSDGKSSGTTTARPKPRRWAESLRALGARLLRRSMR